MSTLAVVNIEPAFCRRGPPGDRAVARLGLRDAGHRADLVVTPQNRFGRQAAAYVGTWLTDVGRTHDDQSIDASGKLNRSWDTARRLKPASPSGPPGPSSITR